MLLQVERVVLNALGKNTALAADIYASRESLAIVFRTSRSTMPNKEQCPPMCTERKNLRTRTRLACWFESLAGASHPLQRRPRRNYLIPPRRARSTRSLEIRRFPQIF